MLCMSSPVRVAIVGVGNCASALVQGVQKYPNASTDDVRPRPHARQPRRLPRPRHPVRRRLRRRGPQSRPRPRRSRSSPSPTTPSASPTSRTSASPSAAVRTLDGIGQYLSEVIDESEAPEVDVAEVLRETQADVLVNYLPVGSEQATRFYMEQALAAGCGSSTASRCSSPAKPAWRRALRRARPADHRRRHQEPGRRDDRPSRPRPTCSSDRGVRLERTSQLNVGGNTDFLNMLERSGWSRRRSPRPRASPASSTRS